MKIKKEITKVIPYLIKRLIPKIITNTILSIKYKAIIDPSAEIYFSNKIKIGKKTIIDKCFLDCKSKNKYGITIGYNSFIHRGVIIQTFNDSIKIGNNVSLQPNCLRNGCGNLRIGDNCRIATNTIIGGARHEFMDKNKLIIEQPVIKKETKIGNDVWVGAGAIIINGVKIGNKCVIGAGSVVIRDIPDNSVGVGVPAKVIKKIS